MLEIIAHSMIKKNIKPLLKEVVLKYKMVFQTYT